MTTAYLKALDHISSLDPTQPAQRFEYLSGLADEDLRQRLIAQWACDYGFEELIPLHYALVPHELVKYRNLSSHQKSKVDPNFWRRPDIEAYIQDQGSKEALNKRNYEWLQTILTWLIPGEDQKQMIMIRQRLREFKEFFEKNGQ